MEKKQALEIFKLTDHFSHDDLKKSYRSLVQKEHPDKGGNVEKFKTIQEALKILQTAFSSSIRLTLQEMHFGVSKEVDGELITIPPHSVYFTTVNDFKLLPALGDNISIDSSLNITEVLPISPFKLMRGGFVNIDFFDKTPTKIYIPKCTNNFNVKILNRGVWKNTHERSDYFFRIVADIKAITEYSEEDLEWLKQQLSITNYTN